MGFTDEIYVGSVGPYLLDSGLITLDHAVRFRDLYAGTLPGVGGTVMGVNLITVTDTPYDPQDDETLILVSAVGGDVTINLPSSVSSNKGRTYHIKKTDSSSNKVIIDGYLAQLVDGETTQELLLQYECLTIVAYSGAWYVI